jgi:hypothetical protein
MYYCAAAVWAKVLLLLLLPGHHSQLLALPQRRWTPSWATAAHQCISRSCSSSSLLDKNKQWPVKISVAHPA